MMLYMLKILAITATFTAHTYGNIAVVTSVVNDEIICEDMTGNIWSYDDTDDIDEGDVVLLVMDDNNTDTIYDDIITDCWYVGYEY